MASENETESGRGGLSFGKTELATRTDRRFIRWKEDRGGGGKKCVPAFGPNSSTDRGKLPIRFQSIRLNLLKRRGESQIEILLIFRRGTSAPY